MVHSTRLESVRRKARGFESHLLRQSPYNLHTVMPQKTDGPIKENLKYSRPHLRFIFLIHDKFPDDSTRLLESLADRDLLFIEAISRKSQLAKKVIEQAINLVFTPPDQLDDKDRQIRQEVLEKIAENDFIFPQLFLCLAGSGKKVVLVDIDPTHSCQAILEKCDRLRDSILTSLKRGMVDTALQYFMLFVAERADFHQQRELVIRDQINEYFTAPGKKNTKAAVIQGLVHSPTTSLFDNDRYEIESITLNQIDNLETKLWLAKRLEQEITEIDYKKALLETYILSDLLPVQQLTDSQVEAALKLFEVTYRQKLARLTNRRRLSQAEKETYAPFAFNQTVTSLFETVKRWIGN